MGLPPDAGEVAAPQRRVFGPTRTSAPAAVNLSRYVAISVSPAMEKLLDVAAEPGIRAGSVREHRDNAGPGPGDAGDPVRAVVPAEQGECASNAAHRTNAGAVALEQASHTLQVLVICAAQHRHVLELAAAERRLQH